MIRREHGFTLVELMITMALVVFALAAASSTFTGLFTQFKQQSKIGEASIEGIIGLEMLRQDIESAGYGLPQDLGGATYQEAAFESKTTWVDRDLNDGPPNNPGRGTDLAGASNPPGAVRSLRGVALNGSDVLSIKSVGAAMNITCKKWTQLLTGNIKKTGLSPDAFAASDRVTAISVSDARLIRSDIASSTSWRTTYSNTSSFAPGTAPTTLATDVHIIYGVDPDTDLRMPFNRADYYVRSPGSSSLPKHCATGTGVLYKGVVNQLDGTLSELPLLDCVAAMHIIFARDTDNNGTVDDHTDNISTLTAADIRAQLKEVRVYVLAQEGQRDPNYSYPNSTVYLGQDVGPQLAVSMSAVTNYRNYRWKIYTMIAKPGNLR